MSLENNNLVEIKRASVDMVIAEKGKWMAFAFTVIDGPAGYKGNSYQGNGEISVDKFSHFELIGSFEDHPKFGKQLKVVAATAAVPLEKVGLVKFLKRYFTGIGEKKATQIVEVFGIDLKDSLADTEKAVNQLVETVHWKRNLAEQFLSEWRQKQPPAQAEVLLMASHFNSRQIENIRRTFSEEEIAKVITTNPFLLMKVSGIGFNTVDKLGKNVGFNRIHPTRVWAGILEILKTEATQKGHCYTPAEILIEEASALLQVEKAVVRENLSNGSSEFACSLTRDEAGDYWHRSLISAEHRIVKKINALRKAPNSLGYHVTDNIIKSACERFAEEYKVELSEEQIKALRAFLDEKVSIVTGGPGTGKTTVLNAFLKLLDELGVEDYYLAAPTGKAAKRIAETCGVETYTLHRLLGIGKQDGSTYDADNPLPCKVMIVDESTMVDVQLMAALTDALKANAHLILIGDVDQLPSVGPGKVYQDLINSGVIPSFRLNFIHRRAQESLINVSAHNINNGLMPVFSKEKDCRLYEVHSSAEMKTAILNLMGTYLPKMGLSAVDIRVLTPFNQGEGGVEDLNSLIQNLVNPATENKKQTIWSKGAWLREGDRLLWTNNNYEFNLMNGEDVLVKDLVFEEKETIVNLERRDINGTLEEIKCPMSLLTAKHAYAQTIHRSQGSEYKCVVVCIPPNRLHFYNRRLLYTAVTRAKTLCVAVGNKQSLFRVISQTKEDNRRTKLRERMYDTL